MKINKSILSIFLPAVLLFAACRPADVVNPVTPVTPVTPEDPDPTPTPDPTPSGSCNSGYTGDAGGSGSNTDS